MKKKIYPVMMAMTLSLSMTVQSFAAGWVELSDGWYWLDDSDNKIKESWHQDTDGTWYYLGADGMMQTGWKLDPAGNLYYLNPNKGDPMGSMVAGWKLINNTWYFFNTIHDGTYGKVLTGWQWIDGYCYYFDSTGKMLFDVVTPDGYTVNKDGRWTEHGQIQYVSGKGIITKVTTNNSTSPGKGSSSGGGGGGSSSGGGSGGNSSGGGSGSTTSKTYAYTVNCIDQSSNQVIKTYSLTAKENTTVTFDYQFEGYELVPGQMTSAFVSENNQVFNLYYEKNVVIPETEFYSYSIIYKDIDSDEVLETETFKGEKDKEITIDYLEIEGYQSCDDQVSTFILDKDNKSIIIYYQKEAVPEEYSFTVQYIDRESGDLLGEKIGTALAGTKVTINFPDFEGYEIESNQSKTYTILEDTVISIYYSLIDDPDAATPTEPEKIKYSYTIYCYDFDSGDLIGSFTNKAEAGKTIEVDYQIPGYTVCEAYSFKIDDDDLTFDIYYKKDLVINKYTFTAYQIDVDTKQRIGSLSYEGSLGEELELDLDVEGYDLLGNPPETVKISSVESNNQINLYYKKIVESSVEPEEVNFTVEFVDVDDLNTHILNDITGTGVVGDTIPIYFYETIRTSDGKQWKSIGSSPQMFELIGTDYNVFTIKYKNIDDGSVTEDSLMQYSIRYVAEDTGATLGITTGYGKPGMSVSFRNNFGTTEYGILNPSNTKLIISENEEENEIEVVYKRISFPGPDKDPITGQYIGSDWTVVFVDNNGKELLPSKNGFSLKNTQLVIDYPDEIEVDGEVYRAKKSSPYREIQVGTTYKQIIIEYVNGDEAESKLEAWKQIAHEAKDKIAGTNPLSYYITYKEKNSWNDIGLRIGIGPEGSMVTIPVPEITDYTAPSEKVDGFKLTEDGIGKNVYYTKFSNGTSNQNIKTEYHVYFQDEDGNNLFEPYMGYVASETDESITKLPVYYPNSFMDKEGNIWEADHVSPSILNIDTLSQINNSNVITYHKTFDNPKEDMVVTNSQEALSAFEAIASRISDSAEKKFYLIGRDYSPKNMNPGTAMITYHLVNYSNEVVDIFELDGITYYISEIHISRTWEENDCVHDWHISKTTTGSCLVNGSETLTCSKCDKTITTVLPAIGHIDRNHDSVCDICGVRAFEQLLGDEILVDFDSETGSKTYTFVCVDDNYNNTDEMLYLSVDDIASSVYGEYSLNGQVRYEDSLLRDFLNDSFADGLSLKSALQPMDQDRVTILSKEEIDTYKSNAENKYLFPSGTYLTKTTNGNNLVLSNGNEISVNNANNYPVKPAILLEKPIEEETPSYSWKVGDVQAREIAGEIYLFRCVNDSYKDKSNTSKKMALFMCDTVIPANMIDDDSTDTIETMFFGDSNNYKYSNIKAWLDNNSTDKLFDTLTMNIGVDTSYSGSTQLNGFSSMNERLLSKHNMASTQYMESKLFVLSVEEAIQMKDYLWKFGETNVDNPESQMKPFSYSYWLRTPEYNTTDKIYIVNLETGRIEPRAVNALNDNQYSETGIRPVFTMVQYE